MRWILASETKPEEGKKVFIRWKHRLTKQDEWEVLYDTSRVFGDAKFWELEWLDESSSPSPLKDVIEEMELDLELIEKIDFATRPIGQETILDEMSGMKIILQKFLPKLKQIGEGSDEHLNKAMFNCLSALVGLKELKDKYGKTPEYLERQPKVWELAKDILKKYPSAGEGSESYWKKRCEAAEDYIWALEEEIMDRWEYKQTWQNFKLAQQLKSSIGEETEGQDG